MLLLGIGLQAQVLDTHPWCPQGATWVYALGSGFGSVRYTLIQYSGDTIILGKAVKKLAQINVVYTPSFNGWNRSTNTPTTEYQYLSNDSLYYYDPVNDNFAFFFSFVVLVGDSFIVKNSRASCLSDSSFPSSDTLHVIDIALDTFGNSIFEYYRVDDYNSNFWFGTIIKNIGSSVQYPMAGGPCMDPSPDYGSLVCYSDSLRGNISFENWGGSVFPATDCQGLISSAEKIADEALETNIRTELLVYPNPSYNIIYVDYSGQLPLKYELYNSNGQLALKGSLSSQTIDVSDLANGIYFIRFYSDKKHFYSKFVKI